MINFFVFLLFFSKFLICGKEPGKSNDSYSCQSSKTKKTSIIQKTNKTQKTSKIQKTINTQTESTKDSLLGDDPPCTKLSKNWLHSHGHHQVQYSAWTWIPLSGPPIIDIIGRLMPIWPTIGRYRPKIGRQPLMTDIYIVRFLDLGQSTNHRWSRKNSDRPTTKLPVYTVVVSIAWITFKHG